jgi:hypothetical protein
MEIPKLKDFLEAFDVPWPVAAGVAVGSGALLNLHDKGVSYLRALPDWAETVLFIFLVYGSTVIVMKFLKAIERWWHRRNAEARRIEAIDSALSSLSADEYEVIRHLVQNNQKSFTSNFGDAHVATLVQKGLIHRAGGTYSILDWPYTVPDDVWMAIQIRRHEFQ